MCETKIYKENQIYYIDGIPVFTDVDTEYIRNYDAIAQEHLLVLSKTGENPYGNKRYTDFITKNYNSYINKYIKDTDYVLDAGVGIGDILSTLKTLNKFGVDISIDYLKVAKDKGINVCLAQLENLPYNDNLFDVVLCKDVFEHVFDLHSCIKSILRVLKKNGYLIFQVPYRQNLDIYVTYTKYKYVHLRNFDEYSIILMFQKIYYCTVLEYSFSMCDFEDNCNVVDVVIQK